MYKSGIILFLLMVCAGCNTDRTVAADATEAKATPEAELAVYMGELQRHSHKLGLALEADNQPLADFYLHEVHEVLEDVKSEAPVHDGHPVKKLVDQIMVPAVEQLEVQVDTGELEAAREAYPRLIEGCNRCHAATEHEFIVIANAAAAGNPYNQSFSRGNKSD